MPTTVASLGARVLRRLGVAIVPATGRPGPGGSGSGAAVSDVDIADRALRRLGEAVMPAAQRVAVASPVPPAEIAARALRLVRVHPVAVGNGPEPLPQVYTFETLGERALDRLGTYAAGEAPTAPDRELAVAKVRAVHEMVNRLGLVDFPPSQVPERAAEPYEIMASVLLAPAFGKAADMALLQAAQDVLRAQALHGPLGQALAVEKVVAVHEALVAMDAAPWLLDAIPAAVAEEYAGLVAARLAPAYGATFDPGAAEARVRAVAVLRRSAEIALQKVRAVHEGFVAAGLADWTLAAIPASVAEDYADLAAERVAPLFGKTLDASDAEARVRRVLLLRSSQALAEQAIGSVHASLSARRKARWTIHDVPDYAAEPYVVLAANILAPSFDKAVDQVAGQWAERDLARTTSEPTFGAVTVASYF